MPQLRVVTLNMQNGQQWDDKDPDGAPVDLDATLEFLKGFDADVIFLQEVEFPYQGLPELTVHPNYDYLRKGLGAYHGTFTYPAATRDHLPFGVGLATFTRLRQYDSFHVVLPASNVEFEFRGKTWLPAERSLLGTHVDIGGRRIQLLNTHLQAYFMIESTSDMNPGQRTVLETVLRGRHHPTILGGDFNCTPEEGTIRGIETCGFKSVQKDIITWYRMPLVLDHIFHSQEFSTRSWRVVDTQVSDHKAVEAVLNL